MTVRWPILILVLATTSTRPYAEEPANQQTIVEAKVTEDDRDHWSLRPISTPVLPDVENQDWTDQPLDYFILSQLEASKLEPCIPASRGQILRRIKFDLVGLPPTPEEIFQFESDPDPAAYPNLVDRLLASPAYGQRWAQHWLDLARFAETDGFEHDRVRKGAWRYRDWVIDAFNSDMPYDQFLRHQLAGDQSQDDSNSIATMFCMAGPDMPDINEQDLRRHDKLNEITSTVGSAILGLQFHCAQCHDHKYDPISQADFYRLRAVFESAIPAMQRDKPVLLLDEQENPQAARFYHRGDLGSPGMELQAGLPRLALREGRDHLCSTKNARAEFCDWLFERENPLTARVIANRIWQHHFGRSLSENPSDFGVIAGEPTHPMLLDWLAMQLHDNDWSIKHLHRVILLSATYQQAGGKRSVACDMDRTLRMDPDNDLYSRFPRKRLEGEVVRDSLLAISGQLNRQAGGLGVMPPLPPELTGTLLKGQWKSSKQSSNHVRRSIYTFARRNLRFPIFDVFDRPDAGASCALRGRSTTATQSLQMLNSDLTIQCARRLRDRILQNRPLGTDPNVSELVQQLFLYSLGRSATSQERDWFEEQFPEDSLRESLLIACVALFNTNEFLYVD